MRIRLQSSGLFDPRRFDKDTIMSLKLVILAVTFGTVCFNITGGIAMTGYLKALGTTDFVFGILYAIGPVASALQIFASYWLERTRKRRKMFIISGLLQRTAWLPFGLVPFFVPMSEPTMRIWMAALFLSITALSAPFMNVSFFSFVTDLVPIDIRGRYFSLRSRIATIVGILGGLLTAWILDRFTGFGGYALVFSLAAVTGIADVACFFIIKFPPMPEPEKSESIFSMMQSVFHNKQYMLLIAFATFWTFSISLSGPFYLVHMKMGMLLSNTMITFAMQILPNLCSILVVSWWGRALDKYGNKSIMFVSLSLLTVAPFLWVFTKAGMVWIIVVYVVMMGLLAAGFDLGIQNLFMGLAPDKNRSMYMAMYLCMTALIGAGIANPVGGWLLDNVFSQLEMQGYTLGGITFTRYNYLFLLTAVLRCICCFVLLPAMLKEERSVPARKVFRDGFEALALTCRRVWALIQYRAQK